MFRFFALTLLFVWPIFAKANLAIASNLLEQDKKLEIRCYMNDFSRSSGNNWNRKVKAWVFDLEIIPKQGEIIFFAEKTGELPADISEIIKLDYTSIKFETNSLMVELYKYRTKSTQSDGKLYFKNSNGNWEGPVNGHCRQQGSSLNGTALIDAVKLSLNQNKEKQPSKSAVVRDDKYILEKMSQDEYVLLLSMSEWLSKPENVYAFGDEVGVIKYCPSVKGQKYAQLAENSKNWLKIASLEFPESIREVGFLNSRKYNNLLSIFTEGLRKGQRDASVFKNSRKYKKGLCKELVYEGSDVFGPSNRLKSLIRERK